MDVIDVQKEVFAEVEIFGHTAMFTELRVDKNTVPKGMYCYELRLVYDDEFSLALEESALNHYFGAVLMNDKLELEKEYLPVYYCDFCYTGEKLKIEEFLLNKKEPKPQLIQLAKNLVEFLDEYDMLLHMTEKEADVLLEYMGDNEYLLGKKDGILFRGDMSYHEQESICWEEYSIDDVIDTVCEWNYDELQVAKAKRENPCDFLDFVEIDNYYKSLREDEKVLDALFDRTKYGKEVQMLAEKLAEEFIQNLGQKNGLENAVKIIADGISKYGEGMEVREEMQYGEGIFEYQGYHFKAKRQFDPVTEDFLNVTRGLKRDNELGLFAENYNGKQKKGYSYEEFYKASTDKNADIFICMENGKEYVPCDYELQEYQKYEPERKMGGKVR